MLKVGLHYIRLYNHIFNNYSQLPGLSHSQKNASIPILLTPHSPTSTLNYQSHLSHYLRYNCNLVRNIPNLLP